jgi:hypothetical protein
MGQDWKPELIRSRNHYVLTYQSVSLETTVSTEKGADTRACLQQTQETELVKSKLGAGYADFTAFGRCVNSGGNEQL